MAFRFYTSSLERYVRSCTWKEIWAVAIIFICSVVALWYVYAQKPLISHFNHQKLLVNELRKKIIQSAENQRIFFENQQKEGLQQATLKSLLVQSYSVRRALDELVFLLKKSNLTCQDIVPAVDHEDVKKNVAYYAVQLTARGTYQEMYRFLSDLATKKGFIVERMLIQKHKQNRLELMLVCKMITLLEGKHE